MVKPTISVKPVTGKKASSNVISLQGAIARIKTDEAFRNQVLLNTANRLALKGFSTDVSFKGVSDTGKSFKLAFDGKESNSKYVVIRYKDSVAFMSSRAIPHS